MSSTGHQGELHIQSVEFPNNPTHISELPGSYYSPEVLRSNQPPEALNLKAAEGTGTADSNATPKQPLSTYSRNPFNLSPVAFGALVSVITALIVGAIIGGSLGGTLAKQEHYKTAPHAETRTSSLEVNRPTPTSTPTSLISTSATLTDYAAPSPSDVETLHIDCPRLDGKITEDSIQQRYKISCGERIVGGGSDVITYSASIAYSLQDCIEACSQLNIWTGGLYCTAVTWSQAMSFAWETEGGMNCWLFNSTSLDSSIEVHVNHTIAIMEFN
ncbi:hypothetical protein F4806DRAFT_8449 [Annulohypoxylon nitens]|nr:hypothetical protein F4806DRAFT_8449 [Annulohypoxylon nitens]